jgi:hypothetical protein
MRILLNVLVLCFYFASIGCQRQAQTDTSPVIASANAHVLTLAEFSRFAPVGMDAQDSVAFAKQYINAWIRNKLLFDKALLNLPDEQQTIEAKAEEYRQSLYIHKYEQQLINYNMDKTVSEEEAQAYYEKHKSEFRLSSDIVLVRFLKIDKSHGQADRIRSWIRSNNEDDIDNLKNIGFQYGSRFAFEEEWLDFDYVLSQLPNKPYNPQGVLRHRNLVSDSDSAHYYYLLVSAHKLKGETAPMEYVFGTIAEIVVQQKKRNLIAETRSKLFRDALNKNNAKIYSLE